MADNDPALTPEKRLLQLIEGGQSEEQGKARPGRKKDFAAQFREFLNPQNIKELIPAAKEKWEDLVKNRKDVLNLKDINKVARILTVTLGLYLIAAIGYEYQVVRANYLSQFEIVPQDTANIEMADKRIFDTDLTGQADNINVFIPLANRVVEKEEKKDEMSLKFVELIQDWKLAGISINPVDPSRSFCMIEDLSKNVTTFLKIGDIYSGLKVDAINPDGITLRFNEETIELR